MFVWYIRELGNVFSTLLYRTSGSPELVWMMGQTILQHYNNQVMTTTQQFHLIKLSVAALHSVKTCDQNFQNSTTSTVL